MIWRRCLKFEANTRWYWVRWARGRGTERVRCASRTSGAARALADQVGACAVALRPLHELTGAHVLAAKRRHGDDTPVPVLAKGKTDTARAWAYMRDDAPFAGQDPPAALFRYSRNRSGAHPVEHLRGFTGIFQADACAGCNQLYAPGRVPGPVTECLCSSHGREVASPVEGIPPNLLPIRETRRDLSRFYPLCTLRRCSATVSTCPNSYRLQTD